MPALHAVGYLEVRPRQGEVFPLTSGSATAAQMGLLGSVTPKLVAHIQAAWDCPGLPGYGVRIQHKCQILGLLHAPHLSAPEVSTICPLPPQKTFNLPGKKKIIRLEEHSQIKDMVHILHEEEAASGPVDATWYLISDPHLEYPSFSWRLGKG